MAEMNVEENRVVSASETAGEEVASSQHHNLAESENPRTEPSRGRLPARAFRTAEREAFHFRLE